MRKSILTCLIGIVLTIFTVNIVIAIDKKNSTNETKESFHFKGQYKKVQREPWQKIKNGDIDEAIKYLRAYLNEYPNDAETYFMLTIAYIQLGKTNKAVEAMKNATEAGLPISRFIAGPRSLLEPLYDEKVFRELSTEFLATPIHGPMLGHITGHSASFWVRTATKVPVRVRLVNISDPNDAVITESVKTTKGSDYTAVVTAHGLKPETFYLYSVQLRLDDGWHKGRYYRFRTATLQGKKSKFTIGFGGGAGYVPPNEYVWNTILSFKPCAFLMQGDNVYIDNEEDNDFQRYCYYRRQSRPEFRSFVASTPIYAIWDDHDFCWNDGWGGPKIDVPSWKRPVWRVFKQNWVNPYYGGGKDQPGCWFDFSIGDVDFFLIDGRYYRTNPEKSEKPSMLGSAQKSWLFDRLKESKATFKILISPVPWNFRSKGKSLDTWNGFREERKEIFDFLTERCIDGVILMSADRHRSDLWKIERDNGYTLYEFESSRLTNQHVHSEYKEALFSYNKKQSFGLVTFDTTKTDPTVTYRIVTIDGEIVHTFTLKHSQLKMSK